MGRTLACMGERTWAILSGNKDFCWLEFPAAYVSQLLQEKFGLKSLKEDDRINVFNTIVHWGNSNIKHLFLQMMFTVGKNLKDSTRQGWRKGNFSWNSSRGSSWVFSCSSAKAAALPRWWWGKMLALQGELWATRLCNTLRGFGQFRSSISVIFVIKWSENFIVFRPLPLI